MFLVFGSTVPAIAHSEQTRSERSIVIRGYSDHAANERTFLAWLRTGIAVIAFVFVVEKFNLFALTLLDTASLDDAHRMRLERLSGSLPQGAGRAFIAVGVLTIVLATVRFV